MCGPHFKMLKQKYIFEQCDETSGFTKLFVHTIAVHQRAQVLEYPL